MRTRPSLGLRQRASIVAAACMLAAAGSAAAAYPDRPIKVFLPFPPGGAVDFVSRLVCAEASEILGKPVVIDHRPGAGGTVATDPNDGDLVDLLAEWVPEEAVCKRILVDNAAKLFGFEEKI